MEEGYRWKILVTAYLCMLAFAVVFQSLPPVLKLIIDELGVTHAQAGLLMSLFALPGILLSIPGGLLSDYYGAKRVGIISLTLMVGGTVIIFASDSFSLLAVGRLLSGIGAMILAIVTAQTLSQWFVGRELGTAMGVYNTAMPVGTILSLTTLGRLGQSLGWRTSILVGTLMSIVALIAFLSLFEPAPPKQQGPMSNKGMLSNIFESGSPIWFVGLAWMWFNAAAISFLTFGPSFFISRGYAIGFAGFLTSFLMWGSLVLSPVVGYTIDKFGGKRRLIGIGGVGLAVVLLLLPNVPQLLIFLMVMMGIVVALVPAPIFSLPSDVLEPQRLGLGFGILSTCLNVGVVLGPYFVGLTLDVTGAYQMGFLLMAGFALLILPTIVLLRVEKA